MEGGSKSGYGVKMTENKYDAPWVPEGLTPIEEMLWGSGCDWLAELIPTNHALPEGYNPAGFFELSKRDADAVNDVCGEVSYCIWFNAKISGRQNKGKNSGRRAIEELHKTGRGAAASFIPTLRKLLDMHPQLLQVAENKEGVRILSIGDNGLTDGEIAILEGLEAVGLPIETLHKLEALHSLLTGQVESAEEDERRIRYESALVWNGPYSPYDYPAWTRIWISDEPKARVGGGLLSARRSRSYRELRQRWILSMAMVWEICTGSWPSYSRSPQTAGPKPKAFLDFCLSAMHVQEPSGLGEYPKRGHIFFTEESGLTHIKETMKRYKKLERIWKASQREPVT